MKTRLISSAALALVLSACASEPFTGMPSSQLDREAVTCQNAVCKYEIGVQYLRNGDTRKGWAYIDLSARSGYPMARTALVNAGRPVPPKDPGSAWE